MAACSGVGKLDRSEVPVPGPAPKIQIGDYTKFELDNGLKVIVVQNDKLPRVSWQLSIDRDPIFEAEKAGYVAMAGSLLSAGTENKSKAEIDEAIDFIGASMNTGSTGIYASSLTKHSDELLSIVSDVLLNPTFPEDELEKVRKQEMSGLANAKTSANSISSNISNAMRYGLDHPYGEQKTEKTVENITREDLIAYYETYMRPNISYLVVVGDITPEEAKQKAETYFGSWEKQVVPKHNYPTPEEPEGNRVAFVPLPGAVQSVINVTYPLEYQPGSEDATAASVMNSVLGGGVFSGRLMQNLREDKAYTYGARSNISSDEVIGYFSAGASVRNEVTDSSITEILYEMDRMTKELVPDSTIKFVKNSINGSFARSLESPQTIARFALNIERYGLPGDYYSTYLERLAAVNSQSVLEAAKKYIKPENAYICVVGNKDEVADKLASFSFKNEVELYNMYGEEWTDMRAAPEGMTAQDVLNKYVDAIGGKEKLSKINSMEQHGTYSAGPMSLEMTIKTKNNDKFLMTIGQGGTVMMKQVTDGKKGSMSQMGQTQALEESDINDMKMQADLMIESKYADYGIEAVLKGIESLDGEDAYVLEVTMPNGTVQSDYYSVDSGLKLQSVQTQETPMGPMTTTTVIKEYAEEAGVKFAAKIEQAVGPQNVLIEVNDISVNPRISDSEFKVD